MEAKPGVWGSLALFCVALFLAGCGGGSSTDPPAKVEASAQFLKETGPNELVEFGTEASPVEREAANAVLEEDLRARAAANFAKQCATLSAQTIKEIDYTAHVNANGKSEKGCGGKLRELASPLSKSKQARENRLEGPIPAMRVKGNRAYALFHGTDGKNWVMPLEKEGGEWRVAALQEEELPPKSASKAPSKSDKSSK